MANILKVRKPSDYSAWVGQTDPHELVSVIDYSAVSPIHTSLNSYEVYALFLQQGNDNLDLTYGTGKYDYSDGTLICVAPGQLGGREDDGETVSMTGWAVLFHPDLLHGTALEKDIKDFSFFDYRVNEALHMTSDERDVIVGLIRQLQYELQFPPDSMQNRIIVGFINLLLRYAQRFYNRQFDTRDIANNDILSRFEALLKDYYDRGEQNDSGLPTIQYCAEKLCLSRNYLSDVVKRTTGETAGNYIRNHIVRRARNLLKAGRNSSEVAYALGFEYPQHFARMFKKMTGQTPTEYVRTR